jgi:hypothetical protein
VTKTDQIDLLHRSAEYFKTHENFDKKEFEEEVLQDTGMIKSFRQFDRNYREERELESMDDFEISPQAVKKQMKVFKSVLKLDKNFHIYIHGNTDLIEQGVENDGRKFYKILFQRRKVVQCDFTPQTLIELKPYGNGDILLTSHFRTKNKPGIC